MEIYSSLMGDNLAELVLQFRRILRTIVPGIFGVVGGYRSISRELPFSRLYQA